MADILIVKDAQNLIPKLGVTSYQRTAWMRDYAIYDINADGSKSGPFGPTLEFDPPRAAGLAVNQTQEGDALPLMVMPDGTMSAAAQSAVRGAVGPRQSGKFRRLASSPIYGVSMQKPGFGLSAIYWPWVWPAYKYLANPLAKYYLYYSTDHSTWGGIGLALSDSPTGPFVQYTPSGGSQQDINCPGTYTNGHANQPGAIYMDAQAGSTTPVTQWGGPGSPYTAGSVNFMQCETPSVIWDESIGMARMFYQVGGSNGRPVYARRADPTGTPAFPLTFYSGWGSQWTMSAVSSDGINWYKDPYFYVATTWNTMAPGDGHTGYFVPFKTRGQWCAYHLYGSTNYARFALSRAVDGSGASNWNTDNRELGPWSHMCPVSIGNKPMQLTWNGAAVVDTEAGPMALGGVVEFASGTAARESYLATWPLSSDLRKPLANPRIHRLSGGALPWEASDSPAAACVMQDGGRTYVYYTTGADYSLGVMEYIGD